VPGYTADGRLFGLGGGQGTTILTKQGDAIRHPMAAGSIAPAPYGSPAKASKGLAMVPQDVEGMGRRPREAQQSEHRGKKNQEMTHRPHDELLLHPSESGSVGPRCFFDRIRPVATRAARGPLGVRLDVAYAVAITTVPFAFRRFPPLVGSWAGLGRPV
jgi:hypothetical protein